MQTENDPWMEFNDASVSDYKFENLDEDVSGEDAQTSGYGGMGMGMGYGWGGKYGKSAYMLVYERRRKKDVKMVVPAPTQTKTTKQLPRTLWSSPPPTDLGTWMRPF